MCPIFVGSLYNFDRSDDGMISRKKSDIYYWIWFDAQLAKKSWIISLVFSQDPSVWCWVFGGGLGPGGFKFRILIKDSLVSVCFWKFKKVGNSKFWICKGFFNGSGLKNIALHENRVFSVLIKWYLHAIILPPEPVSLSVMVVTVALHLLQFTFTGCSPKSVDMILKL